MKKTEMDKLIKGELARIPPDQSGERQYKSTRKLRNYYAIRRRKCLKDRPSQSPVEPFRQAVEDVRKIDPAFSPNLPDPDYFGWS